ncbi:MAG: DNA-binding response regulator [Gemmatimonadota bacterium]
MSEGLLRVLIVDDEELGRDVLRLRLDAVPDVEIIGEASNGDEAVELVLSLRPDLVFLDVQMPGLDGLGVLEAVAAEYLPAVVFVTAHDEYAIRAFEHHALDYLLKPVTPRRLLAALERARVHVARREVADVHARVASLLDQRELQAARGTGPGPDPGAGEGEPLRRIVVRDEEDYRIVKVTDVDAFEAAGNYVRISLPDESYLVRGTLAEYERSLDPRAFARIHRSTIVNVDRIDRVSPQLHGDFVVTLHGGRQYRMSRSFRDRVLP